ncbi:MAG: GGDEF domain-containing protein [Campylobacterota bacterium]|nr:GGDEF domain-containing protein [Campylobacterota bacterium]
MSHNDKLLHIISNETKSSIDQIAVVTPTVYASIFSKYASEHGEEIENEDAISQNILQSECSNLTDLQSQASKSAIQLSDSTTKAISAIKTKDEALLSEVLEETQNLRAEIEKLKEAVYKDELTHSYNRKWLHDTYLSEDRESFQNPGTLVIIDLNYFKEVNDTHGHIIGDKVLVFIANELKKSKQKVIRYGGDEFIIIFENSTKIDKALDTLHQLREGIISKKLKAHNTTFRASFSFGGVSFQAGDLLSETIESADKNMYEDKVQIKKRIKGI